jgi:hypothetical protein
MKIYFFYSSKNCENSAHMWKIMERESILGWFEKMNIDNFTIDQLTVFGLKSVPAILIINNNIKELYEGKDSFKWVEQFIQNRRNNISMMVDANRQKLLQRNNMINKSISDFSKSEMTGLSDDYAYLNTDIAQSKNYANCNMNNQTIITFNEREKLNQNEMKNAMNYVEQQRKQQNEILKNDMRNGQIDAICNNNMIK